MDLISLLIYILVFGLIFWLITLLISRLPIPEPFGTIIYVVLVLIFIIWLLDFAGLLSGSHHLVR